MNHSQLTTRRRFLTSTAAALSAAPVFHQEPVATIEIDSIQAACRVLLPWCELENQNPGLAHTEEQEGRIARHTLHALQPLEASLRRQVAELRSALPESHDAAALRFFKELIGAWMTCIIADAWQLHECEHPPLSLLLMMAEDSQR